MNWEKHGLMFATALCALMFFDWGTSMRDTSPIWAMVVRGTAMGVFGASWIEITQRYESKS